MLAPSKSLVVGLSAHKSHCSGVLISSAVRLQRVVQRPCSVNRSESNALTLPLLPRREAGDVWSLLPPPPPPHLPLSARSVGAVIWVHFSISSFFWATKAFCSFCAVLLTIMAHSPDIFPNSSSIFFVQSQEMSFFPPFFLLFSMARVE